MVSVKLNGATQRVLNAAAEIPASLYCAILPATPLGILVCASARNPHEADQSAAPPPQAQGQGLQRRSARFVEMALRIASSAIHASGCWAHWDRPAAAGKTNGHCIQVLEMLTTFNGVDYDDWIYRLGRYFIPGERTRRDRGDYFSEL